MRLNGAWLSGTPPRLIDPLGPGDLPQRVAKFVPVKSGDFGDAVDVSDQVSFCPDEELVCHLVGGRSEDLT